MGWDKGARFRRRDSKSKYVKLSRGLEKYGRTEKDSMRRVDLGRLMMRFEICS